MPNRPNRISGCYRRFAGREIVNRQKYFCRRALGVPPEINKHSMPSLQIYRFVGGIVVFDALVFEFIGLAMLVLCLAVLAFPSLRPPVRHARDY
jgi:hypothetical protein